MKVFNKLGFNRSDSATIINTLNVLLANYQIHYQKLRNFHWNVEGKLFFELHRQFEEEYNQVKLSIDEIAERIRIFGKKPISTLQAYLDIANIQEAPENLTAQEMVSHTISDFEKLLAHLMTAANAANKIGDLGTEDMLVGFIKRIEKRHWMFNAYIAKSKAPQAISYN